jgi:O-antigen/teichoic acid export membrane protein
LRHDRIVIKPRLPIGSLIWQARFPENAITGLWHYVFRLVAREHFVSLIDQVVVSGTSFLSTLVIARWADLPQLGVYAVGFSLVGFVLTCQDSLILDPYQIQRHYPEGTAAERAGASLTLSTIFSAASVLVLIFASLGFLRWGGSAEMAMTTCSMAALMPIALTRNFVRRFSFARLEFERVLLLDATTALVLLSTLAWLGLTERLSALSAWAALGGAYAISTAIWLYRMRAEFSIRLHHVRTVLKQTWMLGRWLLAAQIASQLQGNATYWLCIAIAGARDTGVLAACMSIVAFANPLVQGLGNTWMPRLVSAKINGGRPALRREAIRSSVLIGALLAVFSLTIFVIGGKMLHLLYPGTDVGGIGNTLTALALSMMAGSMGWPVSMALATVERPLAIIIPVAIGTVLTVTLVFLLLPTWGLLGAAYGLLGGSIVGTVARWVAFSVLVPKMDAPAPQEGG